MRESEGAEVTRRRRGSLPAAQASLPNGDDLLREILYRLPPQPSSLQRASAVCKQWRRLVTDPKFHRQFRAHHGKPPLLGVFVWTSKGIKFKPVLDPPDRIAPVRLSIGRCGCAEDYTLLDCRHGLVLVKARTREEVIVCDPVTREQHRLAVPPEFMVRFFNGAVLCAAGDQGHVHGGCHWRPFKVVLVSTYTALVSTYTHDNRLFARVYSSESGIWGNLILTEAPCEISLTPAVLVGNCLYWLSMSDGIIEFDLDGQGLTVIGGPPVTYESGNGCQIIQAQDGAVGLTILSYLRFQMWQRNVTDNGVATWERWKTIEMKNISGLASQIEGQMGRNTIIGYDEDTDEIFLHVNGSVYAVQLKLLQSRKLYESYFGNHAYSFRSFYAPGQSITGRCNGAEMLRDV